MKRLLFLVVILCIVVSAVAKEKQTLISGTVKSGVYIAPAFKVSKIADEWMGLYGIRGGVQLNESFILGASFFRQARDITYFEIHAPEIAQYYFKHELLIESDYGGLELEYLLNSSSLVHLSLNLLLGVGHLKYVEPRYHRAYSDDRFLLLEPTAAVNINISNNVKLYLSAGYRFASGVHALGLENEDLCNIVYNSSLVVGYY